MLNVRRAQERGHARHGWLESWHTFSFADYHDRKHMGYRSLRVINEDIIAAQRGFGAHPHQDMEILTYVLEGELTHQDSTGAKGVLRPGIIQRMSAGTGVVHSEINHSQKPVHLLQIWIEPATSGVHPRYDDRDFPLAGRRDLLRLLASGDGRDGSLAIHQDADLLASVLSDGVQVRHDLRPGRGAWLQVARGSLELNGQVLVAGDGATVDDEPTLTIRARGGDAEFLLFDLA